MMKTFHLRRTDGTTAETQYHPLLADLGDIKLRLALHKTDAGSWALSDPVSGVRILTVQGSYRGIRVNSTSMSAPEARKAARAQLFVLVEGVGLDKFEKRLEEMRSRFAGG